MRNPLTGFPSAGQPTGLSGLPFLIFWGSFRDFALCGGRPKALPLESASLLKKAGPKTYFCQRCGKFPTGSHNRRRAACRAAIEAWREDGGRGGLGAATRRPRSLSRGH